MYIKNMDARAKRGYTLQLMADEHKKLDVISDLLDISKAELVRACVRKLPMNKAALVRWFNEVIWVEDQEYEEDIGV